MTIQIRPAKIEDNPKIIEVLKAGLGEKSSQKNLQNWTYKHLNNPFGTSIVYIAESNNRIIGVRAFMKWQWQLNNIKYTAWRAVDTATHPDYQRQGVFSKLTLKALATAGEYDHSFIFNTPNKNSKSGYLKLGWQIVGKVKVHITPAILSHVFYTTKPTINKNNWDNIPEICANHNANQSIKNKLFTPKSANYLQWRYVINPFQDYTIYADTDLFLAYYIKKHRFFKELRVSELIGNIYPKKKLIRNYLLQKAKENNCLIISHNHPEIFPISISGKFGPELLVNTLKNKFNFESKILNYNYWSPSIGDLELF